MLKNGEEGGGKLGFLDSLGRLFRSEEEVRPTAPEVAGFAKLEAAFDAAIQGLNEKIEEQRRAATSVLQAVAKPVEISTAERAAEKLRRIEACHRAIRTDIEKMHVQLGSGLTSTDLDEVVRLCAELEGVATAGRDSHDLLPRARYAIAEKLRVEAGTLAVDRLVALLGRADITWPDPIQYHPAATEEDIERSRRRRLTEMRELFVAQSFKRVSERSLGIVATWGGDYPEQNSPLWRESVLEGVAAGIRGHLLREFVALLRQDRDGLLSGVEAALGKELTALQSALQSGVRSIEQANQAIASSLRVLDEVVPEMAWQRVRTQSPSARGEFPA